MTEYQQELFWDEINLIRQRHLAAFPAEQKQEISIQIDNDIPQLKFSNQYSLDDVITSEIQLAFKFTSTFEMIL